jgi:N-acyl-D-aspartate/D-glutamate deacylase
MFDTVIRNGTLVDGTGASPVRSDVAIKDGLIVEVGEVSGAAKRTLNAEGAFVTPGFVDIHTHYDGQVSWDAQLAPSSINGVTSVAMGNCGVGFAPARTDKHDFLIALLEGVEDIPGTALAEGLTWDWESFPDYLDAIGRRRYAIDLGAHMPHAALRAYVMGERGADHTSVPTDDEIAEMERLTFEALEAGALGFSTSRTYAHRTRGGANIGTFTASQAELGGIVAALKRSGKGVVQMISDAYLTADDDFAAAELRLIRHMAKACGRRLSFTVQQTDESPGRWRQIFREIERMNADGLNVSAQVPPRPVGAILGFAASANPFLLTPAYRRIAQDAASIEDRLARLADPAVKAEILSQHGEDHREGFIELLAHGFSRMFRMNDPVDYEPAAESSLAAEAARAGKPAAEHAYEAFLEQGGRRLFYMPLINYAEGDLAATHAMLTANHTLFGLSDGGAHCGTICDGSFPTTTLALWSRGDKGGRTIPLEALVHGYTQRNARHVGWRDRGVLAPGYLADVNVIDLTALNLSPPEIVQDLPAGGVRLLQTARGYRTTLKSGVVTFENGAWTGETPGRLVRGERSACA